MQACLKRQQRGIRYEKTYSLEHEHLLSSILKCPVCGAGMNGSLNRKRRKDGTYRDTFYYLCKHWKLVDGHTCTYRPHPQQARIDADETEARIASMEKARAQLVGAKDNLAWQMDRLDVTDRHYDTKYADMQAWPDSFYDQIAETDADIRKESGSLTKLFQGRATMDNAIRMLRLVQDEFGSMPDAVKKRMFISIIDSVEIFEQPQPDGRQVKCVHFKFPVTVDRETDTDCWYTLDDDEDAGPGGDPGIGPDTGGIGSYKCPSDFRDRNLSRRWYLDMTV